MHCFFSRFVVNLIMSKTFFIRDLGVIVLSNMGNLGHRGPSNLFENPINIELCNILHKLNKCQIGFVHI